MRLAGKTALVTGAASGFGAEIARTFAREGARVGILDINRVGIADVAAEIGPAALPLIGDVTRADEIRAAVSALTSEDGRLDIVVNNAGTIHRNQPMEDVDEASFDRVFAVNVKSIFLMARAVVPMMKARGGGAIVNVGSTAGLRPRPGLTWYNGSKGAVHVLTKSMAGELASAGIRVNAIAPVAGETPLLRSSFEEDGEARRKAIRETIPLGRLSQPADVAGAALYLACDEAAFITGVVLEVDGGRGI